MIYVVTKTFGDRGEDNVFDSDTQWRFWSGLAWDWEWTYRIVVQLRSFDIHRLQFCFLLSLQDVLNYHSLFLSLQKQRKSAKVPALTETLHDFLLPCWDIPDKRMASMQRFVILHCGDLTKSLLVFIH